MKVKIQEVDDRDTFKPVTVAVTFETKEEVEAINNMCWYTDSIPSMITNHKHKRIIIRNFLRLIKNKLESLTTQHHN